MRERGVHNLGYGKSDARKLGLEVHPMVWEERALVAITTFHTHPFEDMIERPSRPGDPGIDPGKSDWNAYKTFLGRVPPNERSGYPFVVISKNSYWVTRSSYDDSTTWEETRYWR